MNNSSLVNFKHYTGFIRILESPGISLSCFQGPGKSLNHYMVLESPGI
jgi:hypothetical protein